MYEFIGNKGASSIVPNSLLVIHLERFVIDYQHVSKTKLIMLTLYELLSLLPPNFKPEFTPRMNDLCIFLMNRERMERQQAAREYLKSIKRLKYFNNLINELKKHLIQFLIPNPISPNSKTGAAYTTYYQSFAAYKLLLTNGKRNAAIEVATKLFPKLQKAELHSLAQIVARDLVFHYSYAGKKEKARVANKYRKQAQILQGLTKIEFIVKDHYYRMAKICNNRESFTANQINEFKDVVEQITPYLQLGLHNLNRLIYTVIISRYAIVSDYENILKYCNEALASFPEDHPNIKALRFSFIHKKIPALVALGQLGDAKELAKEACQLTSEGNSNWHLALIKRVVVCFHSGDYQEAYELFKAYQQQPPPEEKGLEEFWKIIEGYIYFLIQRGKIEPYANEKFYLGKFLNEMPIFSKDKAGHNINIIIIQILVRMHREQFDPIIDRIESLQAYVRSYTRNPETKRANLFIRMIIKMEAAHFHRSGTELRTQKLLKKLEETPLKLGQNLAVEIIPYPILWEEILFMLKDRFKPKKTRKATST